MCNFYNTMTPFFKKIMCGKKDMCEQSYPWIQELQCPDEHLKSCGVLGI